jgi:hypothetical protein
MRKLLLAGVATITVVTGAALSTVPASADFLFGGHKHCWYDDGWHGAGWYWCGYAHRHGRGWGGPEGWQGWHR